jgi:hypothetical protein
MENTERTEKKKESFTTETQRHRENLKVILKNQKQISNIKNKSPKASVSLCLCGKKLFLFFCAPRVLRGEDFLVCASVVNQLFPATDSKSRCLFANFLCHSAAA